VRPHEVYVNPGGFLKTQCINASVDGIATAPKFITVEYYEAARAEAGLARKETEMDGKQLEILKTRVRNERDTREEIIRAVNGRADRLTHALMQLGSRTAMYRAQSEAVHGMCLRRKIDGSRTVSDGEFDFARDLLAQDIRLVKEAFDEVLAAQAECCLPVNHEALLRIAKDELRHAQDELKHARDSRRENEVALLEKAVLYHQRMLAARQQPARQPGHGLLLRCAARGRCDADVALAHDFANDDAPSLNPAGSPEFLGISQVEVKGHELETAWSQKQEASASAKKAACGALPDCAQRTGRSQEAEVGHSVRQGGGSPPEGRL
jgi:hypothetical protein